MRFMPPTALEDPVDEHMIGPDQSATLEDELRRHHDRAERRAKIMAENGEKPLLRLVDVVGVARERLGNSLIDGLVEPDHLVELRLTLGSLLLSPEPYHARA